jgi:hypothetical protein
MKLKNWTISEESDGKLCFKNSSSSNAFCIGSDGFVPASEISGLPSTTTTTTVPLPKEVPSDPNKRCPAFEHKFAEYNLPVEIFSYIAWRESGCNPKAVNAKWDANGNVIWTLNKNGSIDRGLVQINSSWQTVTKNVCGTKLSGLFNVDCNLKVAKYIMDNSVGKLNNWSISN